MIYVWFYILILTSCNHYTEKQYWGEMGFLRVKTGTNLLGLESMIAWATPGQYTTENNIPCGEGGGGCGGEDSTDGPVRNQFYRDPSMDVETVQRKLIEGGHWAL